LALLKSVGVTRHKAIIAYCTGGVRSAWLVAVLVELGYRDARNYAGSLWQWAAGPKDRYRLIRYEH
jgi:thiosulfate/3-mercaptopyruvate sulfurtransferase